VDADRLQELAARVAGDDGPDDALRAIAELREELEHAERARVAAAIEDGWSWRRVADALGVSKQSAHRKHRHLAGPTAGATRQAQNGGGRVLITGEARRTMRLARKEAEELGHACVRPDHVLLGLLRLPSGRAAAALNAAGLSLPELRDAVAELGDSDGVTQPGVTNDARRVMERALRYTVARRDGWLGGEHLLLSALDEASTIAALSHVGATPSEVRRELDGVLTDAVPAAAGSRAADACP
jgi:hypothetical protein